jgi:hypothetical protein
MLRAHRKAAECNFCNTRLTKSDSLKKHLQSCRAYLKSKHHSKGNISIECNAQGNVLIEGNVQDLASYIHAMKQAAVEDFARYYGFIFTREEDPMWPAYDIAKNNEDIQIIKTSNDDDDDDIKMIVPPFDGMELDTATLENTITAGEPYADIWDGQYPSDMI